MYFFLKSAPCPLKAMRVCVRELHSFIQSLIFLFLCLIMTFRQIGTTQERGKGGDDVGENERKKNVTEKKR